MNSVYFYRNQMTEFCYFTESRFIIIDLQTGRNILNQVLRLGIDLSFAPKREELGQQQKGDLVLRLSKDQNQLCISHGILDNEANNEFWIYDISKNTFDKHGPFEKPGER